MAVTTSYSWILGPGSFLNDVFTADNQFWPAVTSNFEGDRYFAVWIDPANNYQVNGRIVSTNQIPLTGEFIVHNTANAGTVQFNPSVAGLTGGRFVVTYTDYAADPGGDIRARLYDPTGTPHGSDFVVDSDAFDDSQSSVSALSGGGFVVSYTRSFGGGDTGIRAHVFDQNGNDLSNLILVEQSPGEQTNSAVAGLSSGGFVAVWQDDSFDEVYFRRYQSNGNALDADRVLIDSAGSINQDIGVVALADGGFAVAYTDNGWGADGTEITFRIYNANGTSRTDFIRANDSTNGIQSLPTITMMGDMIVVGWLDADAGSARVQVFDALGNRLGDNTGLSAQVFDPEFAGLANGLLATVRTSSVSEGAGLGDSIRSSMSQFVRSQSGDSADDVIVGIDDDLHERLFGLSGNDILIGGAGGDELFGNTGSDAASYETAPAGVTASLADPSVNTGHAAGDTYFSVERLTGSSFDDTLIGNASANILTGGAGNDTLRGGGTDSIDGGAGDDTAVFSLNFNDYTVQDFGATIVVTEPAGLDATLTSIEHLQFANTTITPANVANDGNPLFDALHYLSRNPDVFQAAMDPLFHFNAFGWHEGRDPNGFFDSSGYRAANPDVAASGMNPLDHYHQSGWREGRDPGANFDTTLYLLRNPDVAAAGIDPLFHYLASGMTEGRQAYAAIGQNITGGFDAQYYLFHNPDVAAAGVDPLLHYNVVGWQEGRDPNGWFDTSGYLAYYGDVAAAGINAFDHYMAVGWKEGRDASTWFDTAGYLALHPDVAAAGMNPLQHFLQFGIYEGRQAVNDGTWG